MNSYKYITNLQTLRLRYYAISIEINLFTKQHVAMSL